MFGYFIAAAILIFLVFIFSRFRPAATQKITENLYAVSCGFVNFYAVKTGKGVALFDTGTNPAAAKRGLLKLGMPPDSVTHIFLTHTDYDHSGGISAFPGAERYILKLEEQMINGETARRGFLRNRRLSNYHTLEDGEIVSVGDSSVKVYAVPGHTPGSAAYLIDNRFLASGDLLRVSGKGKILPFLWLMNMNHRQNIESVKAMQSVINGAEYILTGHTGVKRAKNS